MNIYIDLGCYDGDTIAELESLGVNIEEWH